MPVIMAIVCFLLVAAIHQPAMAAEGDTFQPRLSYSSSYDDNLFRLPDSAVTAVSRSDTFHTLQGGIAFEKRISQQNLTASMNLGKTKFDENSQLNNDTKDMLANWNWRVGLHLEGNVGASYLQSLTPYTEFHSSQRNLRTQEREYFDAAWRLHPSWSMHGGVSRYTLDYELDTQKFGNRTEDASELGLDFIARSNSSVGFVVRRVRGGFPTPQVIGPLVIDNSYKQDEYKVKVNWLFSGKSRLQFLGGWAQRKHVSFPARDASGPSARLIADWVPSGKASVTMIAWRDINASDDLTASYTLNKGLSLAPRWGILPKLRMEGMLKYEDRDFSGATAFTALLPSNRKDTSRYASLGLTYAVLQNTHIGASVFQDTLTTNIPQGDYRAKGMTISLRSVF